MTESEALALRNDDTGVALIREPAVVLEEARRAARALKDVIDGKPHKVMFGGQQYLEFEDWQTVGQFYDIAPRIVREATRPVTFGAVSGWEAFAEAVHVPTGRVVSSADAMCLDDEANWRARPKYDWHYVTKTGALEADPPTSEMIWEAGPDGKRRPKKSRVSLGEEPVPAFQLRSMAQTRAAAKALRNALAWVVVLAGYRPTPAEEMTGPRDDAPAPRARPLAPPADREGPTEAGGADAGDAAPALAEDLERSVLITQWMRAADAKKLKADARATMLHRHGITDPRTANLASLRAMVQELGAAGETKETTP